MNANTKDKLIQFVEQVEQATMAQLLTLGGVTVISVINAGEVLKSALNTDETILS